MSLATFFLSHARKHAYAHDNQSQTRFSQRIFMPKTRLRRMRYMVHLQPNDHGYEQTTSTPTHLIFSGGERLVRLVSYPMHGLSNDKMKQR